MEDGVIEFTIPFTVQAKQSDRTRIVTRKDGTQYVHHYQSNRVVINAQHLAAAVCPHRPPAPWDGPVGMEVTYIYPWRSTESKRKRAAGEILKWTAPDLEQLDKQLTDVLESAGFVTNDSRIVARWSCKKWGNNPGVHVRLEKLEINYVRRTASSSTARD